MAIMKKQEIIDINNKCCNNWRFDTQYFVYHQEKTLIKIISINDESYLEFRLDYNSKNQIYLHISKYYTQKHTGMATSEGIGRFKILEETAYKRKGINNLIIKTQNLTDEELLKINDETEVIDNGIVISS